MSTAELKRDIEFIAAAVGEQTKTIEHFRASLEATIAHAADVMKILADGNNASIEAVTGLARKLQQLVAESN